VTAEALVPVIDAHTTAGKRANLDVRYDEAVHAGSARAVERQHAKGKKTARERIALLIDDGSFIELDGVRPASLDHLRHPIVPTATVCAKLIYACAEATVPAERGYVDVVIAPSKTRSYVTRSLRMLQNKRQPPPPGKQVNIPL
jgi:acetyl-CoA carboxylase carboxyltransferase component